MKRLHYVIMFFAVSVLILLPACYEDSNTGPDDYNKSQNLLTATVEGDVKLDFTTKSVSYRLYSAYTQLSASMVSGPFEIYSFEICFPDTADHFSFDLSGSDTLSNFKVYMGHIPKEYYFRNITGKLDFERRSQDTISGVFSFFAEDSLLKKSITVKNGYFKYIKKKA